MNSPSRSLLSPRAIQNARTRIFVPGSDPRFGTTPRVVRPIIASARTPAPVAPPTPRLFSPALLDRLHAPLTRYAD